MYDQTGLTAAPTLGQSRGFIDTRLYRVTGFLHPADAMTLAVVSRAQHDRGWTGAIAEIGVYYGRLYALIGALMDAGREQGLAADIFAKGDRPEEGAAQRRAFEATIAGIGRLRQATTIVEGDSADLTGAAVRDTVGPVRLFSVDGGHELHHVHNDARVARDALAETGVIAFDDFMNPQYPDVSVGVIDFLRGDGADLRPFCITKAKLYVCPAAVHADYVDAVKTGAYWAGVRRESFTVLGAEVVHCLQSVANRALYQKAAERGLGAVARRFLKEDRPVHRR